jgi:hypothetical protein
MWIVAVIGSLHDDLQQLCKSRNIHSFRDSLSSYDEINNLWKAIAKRIKVSESIFHESMIVVYPELKVALDARIMGRTRLQ